MRGQQNIKIRNSSIKYSRASSRRQVVEWGVNQSFEDLRREYFIKFSRRKSFQLHANHQFEDSTQ